MEKFGFYALQFSFGMSQKVFQECVHLQIVLLPTLLAHQAFFSEVTVDERWPELDKSPLRDKVS